MKNSLTLMLLCGAILCSISACKKSEPLPTSSAASTTEASGATSPGEAGQASAGHIFQAQEDALNKAKNTAAQMSKEGENTAKSLEEATK